MNSVHNHSFPLNCVPFPLRTACEQYNSLSWYRFVIGQYVTVAGDVISHVNISRVAVEDGGVYECAAENRVGRATHSAPLRVYGNVTHPV
jgi:hypothetical protein